MPLELQTDGTDDDEPEPGQLAYEALQAVAVDADEFSLMGLLGALQRGIPWEKVPPQQRKLCELLEGELFEDGGD